MHLLVLGQKMAFEFYVLSDLCIGEPAFYRLASREHRALFGCERSYFKHKRKNFIPVAIRKERGPRRFEKDLHYGDSGAEVEDLQQFLIYEGSYTEAIVSGYFGNYTRNAVIKFQKKYGVLPSIGFVGPRTRHQMELLTGL